MPSIRTTITIQASPSVVRKVFFDFPSYPQWNPWITLIESPVPSPPPGTRLKFVAAGHPITSTVIENTPERFSWVGTVIGPWFFYGQHFFDFEPFGEVAENGETLGCRFVHYENFCGWFAWLVLLFVRGMTERGFNDMNAALKTRAESLTES